jgi:lysophospholipase L1-like esterase
MPLRLATVWTTPIEMKKQLGNFLVLLVSSVACLLLLETAYRFYLFRWDMFSIEKLNSVHPIGLSGLIQPSPFKDLIFELRPNQDTYFKLVPFITNSRGLRDKEYAVEKPAGVFRVAVMGDSFSLPSGVAIEDAYHSLIEERLNRAYDRDRYEVINFSVGGYTLEQYLIAIRRKALAYDPDLILIGFCAENDDNVHQPDQFPNPYQPLGKTYPFYRSFALDAVAFKLQSMRIDQERGRELAERQERYLARVFSELAELGRTEGIPIVVAYLSNQPANYRPIEEIARANGIQHFVDTSTAFRGTRLDDYRILPIDNHPNAQAQRIFAREIYDYLVRNELLQRESDE